MPTINIETTCAFTGHRVLPKNFNIKEVEFTLQNLIESGFNTFLIGMALGFDTLCFSILENFKKSNDIRLIACVPCKNQDKFFNKKQEKNYNEMLKRADEVIVLSEEYFDGCMQKRNEFMVDNACILVAFLTYNRGGTYSTVKYAVEKERKIIYVGK